MISEKINKKILEIWKKYPNESGELYPLLYPEFKKDSVLFIGLNPSFSEKGFNLLKKKDKEIENMDFIRYCNKNNSNFNPDMIVKLEEVSKEKYPYFNKFKIISKK